MEDTTMNNEGAGRPVQGAAASVQQPDTKPFTEVLREIDRGRLLPEIEEKLADVVKAVLLAGKAGSLNIKLGIKKAGSGDSNQLIIDAEVTAKEPKMDRAVTLFFADDAHQLRRRDPRQYDLDLRAAVPRPIRPE